MGQMVRTTVIGLLSKGVTFDDVQRFVDDRLTETALAGYKTIQGVSTTADGEKRLHVKFIKLCDADKLDHRWNIDLSNEFQNAGYGHVAWKFTQVDSEDPQGENTTASIHPGLFKECLDSNESEWKCQTPPEPFGSVAFWQWFDEQDK